MSYLMLDVSQIYELLDEFIQDQRDIGFNEGIDTVTSDPESYGLTRIE